MHGALLKRGVEVSQAIVAKDMGGFPQGWVLLPNSPEQPFRLLRRQNGRCACAHGGGHRATPPADQY
jgi:hypothetical protein